MPANVENMFYVGETPWHKEGNKLENPPNTSAAIKSAGLDWDVEKVNIYTENKDLIPNYYGIQRKDTGKVLGVVRKEYLPLQNSKAFDFLDPLVDKFLHYETAGSLGDGEIIWILAKFKENASFKVKKNDVIDKYLLLSNSHDGHSAVSIKFTPIRVVCQNTLNVALAGNDATKISHLTSMHKKLKETQMIIEDLLMVYRDIENKFELMSEYKMSRQNSLKYFNDIYPVVEEKDIKTDIHKTRRISNIETQEQLLDKFVNGYGIKVYGVGGTLWAAYNAVTEYIDHPKNYKLGDNRFLKRIWFGEGDEIKKKAYLKALDLLCTA